MTVEVLGCLATQARARWCTLQLSSMYACVHVRRRVRKYGLYYERGKKTGMVE